MYLERKEKLQFWIQDHTDCNKAIIYTKEGYVILMSKIICLSLVDFLYRKKKKNLSKFRFNHFSFFFVDNFFKENKRNLSRSYCQSF